MLFQFYLLPIFDNPNDYISSLIWYFRRNYIITNHEESEVFKTDSWLSSFNRLLNKNIITLVLHNQLHVFDCFQLKVIEIILDFNHCLEIIKINNDTLVGYCNFITLFILRILKSYYPHFIQSFIQKFGINVSWTNCNSY